MTSCSTTDANFKNNVIFTELDCLLNELTAANISFSHVPEILIVQLLCFKIHDVKSGADNGFYTMKAKEIFSQLDVSLRLAAVQWNTTSCRTKYDRDSDKVVFTELMVLYAKVIRMFSHSKNLPLESQLSMLLIVLRCVVETVPEEESIQTLMLECVKEVGCNVISEKLQRLPAEMFSGNGAISESDLFSIKDMMDRIKKVDYFLHDTFLMHKFFGELRNRFNPSTIINVDNIEFSVLSNLLATLKQIHKIVNDKVIFELYMNYLHQIEVKFRDLVDKLSQESLPDRVIGYISSVSKWASLVEDNQYSAHQLFTTKGCELQEKFSKCYKNLLVALKTSLSTLDHKPRGQDFRKILSTIRQLISCGNQLSCELSLKEITTCISDSPLRRYLSWSFSASNQPEFCATTDEDSLFIALRDILAELRDGFNGPYFELISTVQSQLLKCESWFKDHRHCDLTIIIRVYEHVHELINVMPQEARSSLNNTQHQSMQVYITDRIESLAGKCSTTEANDEFLSAFTSILAVVTSKHFGEDSKIQSILTAGAKEGYKTLHKLVHCTLPPTGVKLLTVNPVQLRGIKQNLCLARKLSEDVKLLSKGLEAFHLQKISEDIVKIGELDKLWLDEIVSVYRMVCNEYCEQCDQMKLWDHVTQTANRTFISHIAQLSRLESVFDGYSDSKINMLITEVRQEALSTIVMKLGQYLEELCEVRDLICSNSSPITLGRYRWLYYHLQFFAELDSSSDFVNVTNLDLSSLQIQLQCIPEVQSESTVSSLLCLKKLSIELPMFSSYIDDTIDSMLPLHDSEAMSLMRDRLVDNDIGIRILTDYKAFRNINIQVSNLNVQQDMMEGLIGSTSVDSVWSVWTSIHGKMSDGVEEVLNQMFNEDYDSFDSNFCNVVQVRNGLHIDEILGLAAGVCGAAGADVYVAYSKQHMAYAEQDYTKMSHLFRNLGIESALTLDAGECVRLDRKDRFGPIIHYCTIDTLYEQFIQQQIGVAPDSFFLSNGTCLTMTDRDRPRVLLIDDIEAFYTQTCEKLYTNTILLQHASIKSALKIIWALYSRGELVTVEKVHQLTNRSLHETFSKFSDVIEQAIDYAIAVLYSNDNDKMFTDSVADCYKSMWALFQAIDDGLHKEDILAEKVGLYVKFGHLSLANILPLFKCIGGVSITSLSTTQKDTLKHDHNVQVINTQPSITPNVYIKSDVDLWFREIESRVRTIRSQSPSSPVVVYFEDDETLLRFRNWLLVEQSEIHPLILTSDSIIAIWNCILQLSCIHGQVTLLTKTHHGKNDFVRPTARLHVIQTFFSKECGEEKLLAGYYERNGECASYDLILLEQELNKLLMNASLYLSSTEQYTHLQQRRQHIVKGFKSVEEISLECSMKLLSDIRKGSLQETRSTLLQINKPRLDPSRSTRTLILMDATSSMEPVHRLIASTFNEIVSKAIIEGSSSQVTVEFQFAVFRDYDCGVDQVLESSAWTSDPVELIHWLKGIQAFGGDDVEEAVEIGLWHALKESRHPDGLAQVILIGDAPPKTIKAICRDRAGCEWFKFGPPFSVNDILPMLADATIPIHTLYTKEDAKDSFKMIGLTTSGRCEKFESKLLHELIANIFERR